MPRHPSHVPKRTALEMPVSRKCAARQSSAQNGHRVRGLPGSAASVESADPRGGKCRTRAKFESRRRCLPEKSNRPTPGTTSNPAIEQGGCPGGVRGTRAGPRVRPLNNYRHPKFPRGVGALSFNSSMCRPSFRSHFQQPPRPPFVGVSLRTEQCRLQPTLRRRPLP